MPVRLGPLARRETEGLLGFTAVRALIGIIFPIPSLHERFPASVCVRLYTFPRRFTCCAVWLIELVDSPSECITLDKNKKRFCALRGYCFRSCRVVDATAQRGAVFNCV